MATRKSQSLGLATIFVPAAEPHRVWMINYGPRIGNRDPDVWQVDVDSGIPLSDPSPLGSTGHPQIGILGGLVLQTENGLTLWDKDTDTLVPLDSDGPGMVFDVHEAELVWCGDECSSLRITNTSTLDTDEFDPPDGYDVFGPESLISPSGRYLAALIGVGGEYEGRGIWILDRNTGGITVVSDAETRVNELAWAPDSDQLFATSWSYQQERSVIWRYQITDREFTPVVLRLGNLLSLVVVDSSLASSYIARDRDQAGS